MTITTTQPTVTAEWGVRLTWPDGHTEVRPEPGRASAESGARHFQRRNEVDPSAPSATIVVRTVTVTAWEVSL